jgi:hypothetical protein
MYQTALTAGPVVLAPRRSAAVHEYPACEGVRGHVR